MVSEDEAIDFQPLIDFAARITSFQSEVREQESNFPVEWERLANEFTERVQGPPLFEPWVFSVLSEKEFDAVGDSVLVRNRQSLVPADCLIKLRRVALSFDVPESRLLCLGLSVVASKRALSLLQIFKSSDFSLTQVLAAATDGCRARTVDNPRRILSATRPVVTAPDIYHALRFLLPDVPIPQWLRPKSDRNHPRENTPVPESPAEVDHPETPESARDAPDRFPSPSPLGFIDDGEFQDTPDRTFGISLSPLADISIRFGLAQRFSRPTSPVEQAPIQEVLSRPLSPDTSEVTMDAPPAPDESDAVRPICLYLRKL